MQRWPDVCTMLIDVERLRCAPPVFSCLVMGLIPSESQVVVEPFHTLPNAPVTRFGRPCAASIAGTAMLTEGNETSGQRKHDKRMCWSKLGHASIDGSVLSLIHI